MFQEPYAKENPGNRANESPMCKTMKKQFTFSVGVTMVTPSKQGHKDTLAAMKEQHIYMLTCAG